MSSIKNIAIIAHVDHGKTTLVDQILNFTGDMEKAVTNDRVMDSNDLERERGITILSKNTAVIYKDVRVNIIDTPGHSDFGGEVERVLKMADTSLLVVDAAEGPMPQTRFVLKKALDLNQKIILCVNKVDRPGINVQDAVEKTLELFLELDASDTQIDFPIIYASAKEGYAMTGIDDERKDIAPLLDCILDYVPDSPGDKAAKLEFQVTTLDYDDYLGRICVGRVFNGTVNENDIVFLHGINEDKSAKVTKHKITKLFSFESLKRIPASSGVAGDIVALAGIPEMTIGDTLTNDKDQEPLTRIFIEPPTVSMLFLVNDSPLGGKDGKYVTSRQIRERLFKELQTNVSLQVEEQGEKFKVSGRGELQLAILIENMRREGFELGVSKPEVIIKEIDGEKREPFEELVVDLPQSYAGGIIRELNRRKGLMISAENLAGDFNRLRYEIPTRGLIGFRSYFLTESRGEGSMTSLFLEYRPLSGEFDSRSEGALVSMENGQARGYSLFSLQERGELFVKPQTDVYMGMIIGLHNRDTDLDVNPVKEKKMSNVRSSGADEAIKLVPPRMLTLEQCLDLLANDEILEVTPHSLRLRKKILNPAMRKKSASSK